MSILCVNRRNWGCDMAENTMQAVLQAELTAARLEKEAIEQKDALLSQAQRDVAQNRDQLGREAEAYAEKLAENAAAQCDLLMREAVERAEKAIAALRLQAKEQEKEAIRLITDELFS